MEKKTFMITGGNFTNKGAQSMIMITVSEIRKRFSDADIYILPNDDYRSYDTKNLRFSVLRNHTDFFLINCGFLNKLKLLIKNVVRFCLMRDVYIFEELRTYTDTIKKIDCILDISGFCLSSQFETEYNMMLLNIIKEGKKYDIPVILLPQSFGPFDYKENKDKMLKLIKNELSYPYAVFAREKNGYKLLKSVLRDDHNLRLSSDLVLQNKDINLSDIFVKVVNDRTMLPARFVAENLGAKVSWDEDKQLVTITGKQLKTDEDITILIYIDSDIAYVNGKEIKLDSPAFIDNDRTYTPVRFVAEEFGADVEWIETEYRLVITK